MPVVRICLVVILGVVAHPAFAQTNEEARSPLRTWTDATGQFSTEATFLRFDEQAARLRKPDGAELAVPVERLSENDRAYLRQRILTHKAGDSMQQALFDGPGEGLHAEYFIDCSFDEIGLVRTDSRVDFKFGKGPIYAGGKPPKSIRDGQYEHFAIRWTGLLVSKVAGTHTIFLEIDDGGLLWLDDALIIRAWKDQGPTEYTAEVDLVADRPRPIKLLYYNRWFGGSAKLSWLPPGGPKQVIPQSALFLPPIAPDEDADKAVTLTESQVRIDTIELPAAVRHRPERKKRSIILHPVPEGGYKLAWNDTEEALHISTLNDAFDVVGDDTEIPGVDLRGFVVHEDGSVGLMVAQKPRTMWAMELGSSGELVSRLALVGDKGDGPKQHYLDEHFSFTGRFCTSGDLYAAHFAHSQNTGEHGVHQGGYFALIDRQGKLVEENNWTVSHSLDQRLLWHRDAFFTLSAGDCFPKGIVFENRTLKMSRIVYPTSEHREEFGNCAGFVNATFGSMTPVGNDIGITFITGKGEAETAIYMLLREDCSERLRVNLSETAEVHGSVVRIAPFGNQLLLAWYGEDGGTRLAVMSRHGRLLTSPITTERRLPQSDDLVLLQDGTVAWIAGEDGKSTVAVVRVAP